MQRERNWAGNHEYRAERIHAPRSLDEVASIVASAHTVARARLPAFLHRHRRLDGAALAGRAARGRGRRPRRFDRVLRRGPHLRPAGRVLREAGLALANLASLPHISVAGAVATATHGSGDANRNLADAVAGLELVTSDGELVKIARGEPDFDGLRGRDSARWAR